MIHFVFEICHPKPSKHLSIAQVCVQRCNFMHDDTVHITSAKLRLHAWKPHPVIQKFLRTSEIIFISRKKLFYKIYTIFSYELIE